MTQYITVKLSNLQLNKLKSRTKNGTKVTLNLPMMRVIFIKLLQIMHQLN